MLRVSGDAILRQHDEINKTNQYFVIQGFQYIITVTYCSIHIGCRDYTIDQLDTAFDDCELTDKESVDIIKLMVEVSLDEILSNIPKE